MRFLFGLLLFSWAGLVPALQSISLSLGNINASSDWELRDVSLTLSDIDQDRQQWSLQSALLRLPEPFDLLSGVQISCAQFQWRDGFIQCSQGKGRIESAKLHTPEFDFSCRVQDSLGTIDIHHLSIFGGIVSINAREKEGVWRVEFEGRKIDLGKLGKFVSSKALQSLSGTGDLDLTVKGRRDELKEVFGKALLRQLNIVAGKVASENAQISLDITANQNKQTWRWQHAVSFRQGGLYIEPIYLEAPPEPIVLSAYGVWRLDSGEIGVESALLQHPGVGQLEATADLNINEEKWLKQAFLKATIPELDTASPIYLTPFLEAGPLESITLAGKLDAALKIQQGAIADALFDVERLDVGDSLERFQVTGAEGGINWRPEHSGSSTLHWQGLKLKTIPVGPGSIDFTTEAKRFVLNHQTDIPLLGGELSIKEFSVAKNNADDADVHFSGKLKKLSLEQLSEAFSWTPLSGEISGNIPAVTYRDKKLELGGKLTMQLFGGEVTIKKLASSGMFTDFAQFYADVELDNLDLNAITRKFQFGFIEGRLSGYIHDLYLENWRPIKFYAWLGTPENDDSEHRISQKAVENIASIGGGGAADAISRGFLRFFDTFGYDKLGFGCYLNNSVCQMMGVEAAENGYYLVKGGGLPRIDVIGYNPRLDWNVLLHRLSRITATNNAVIE